eukprot:scaffold3886_cov399-Prasinococcus_capsulatus_cf.AAC.18
MSLATRACPGRHGRNDGSCHGVIRALASYDFVCTAVGACMRDPRTHLLRVDVAQCREGGRWGQTYVARRFVGLGHRVAVHRVGAPCDAFEQAPVGPRLA